MSLAAYNEINIVNTLSVVFATLLMNKGYLVYFHETDLLWTPDGAYPAYNTNRATYLADSVVAARVAAAKGVVTLRGDTPAIPRYIVRLPDDSRVGEQDEIAIPALSITIGPTVTGPIYEVNGGKPVLKWRIRRLRVEGYGRDHAERVKLGDFLQECFDEAETFTVVDHEAATLAEIGPVTVRRPDSTFTTTLDAAEAQTFKVLFNARLEYVC